MQRAYTHARVPLGINTRHAIVPIATVSELVGRFAWHGALHVLRTMKIVPCEDPPTEGGEAAPPRKLRQSSRKKDLRVMPSSSIHKNAGDTVLVGQVFNADAERADAGLGQGQGEECCIAMEPIADASLEFAPGMKLDTKNPKLTGVQLLCGHRFSAINLMWHWCISPMVCPVCRHEFHNPGVEVSTCVPENFPASMHNVIRGKVQQIEQEREQEERDAAMDSVMDDINVLFESTVNALQELSSSLYLSITLVTHDNRFIAQSIPLRGAPFPADARASHRMQYAGQRSAMRIISSRLRDGGNIVCIRAAIYLGREFSVRLTRVNEISLVQMREVTRRQREEASQTVQRVLNQMTTPQAEPRIEPPPSPVQTPPPEPQRRVGQLSIYEVASATQDIPGNLTITFCEDTQSGHLVNFSGCSVTLHADALMAALSNVLNERNMANENNGETNVTYMQLSFSM